MDAATDYCVHCGCVIMIAFVLIHGDVCPGKSEEQD